MFCLFCTPESLTLESGGCFDLLKIGHNQNNDLDSPHPLSIMSAIYPITGIDCIAMSSHSMYLNLFFLKIIIKGVVPTHLRSPMSKTEPSSAHRGSPYRPPVISLAMAAGTRHMHAVRASSKHSKILFGPVERPERRESTNKAIPLKLLNA